jgi:hypothetical protein
MGRFLLPSGMSRIVLQFARFHCYSRLPSEALNDDYIGADGGVRLFDTDSTTLDITILTTRHRLRLVAPLAELAQ